MNPRQPRQGPIESLGSPKKFGQKSEEPRAADRDTSNKRKSRQKYGQPRATGNMSRQQNLTFSASYQNGWDGVSNYNPWKERIMSMLMENGIREFANTQITPPTNLAQLVIHNQKDVKDKRIILDGVKDHLIPHLSGRTLRGTCERL
jgi:hypothetical protein